MQPRQQQRRRRLPGWRRAARRWRHVLLRHVTAGTRAREVTNERRFRQVFCYATKHPTTDSQAPLHPSLPDRRANGSSRGPPKFVHKATPARLMRRARSSHNYHGKRMGAIDAVNEWRLPKVSEEADEAVDQKDWQDDAMSSRVSSARDWNFESDSAYEGSNHDGRAFDHTEVEDCAAAVQRMERRLRCPARKHEENAVHAKLVAWKDAQIAKLIEKLNQKEAQIDKWQKNKIAQARHKLTKTEKKLEKQRAEAVVKMQKAIEDAERRADKKRVKKQAATNSRIDGVKRALEEMSRTGRLPWTLAFL
uniref:Remorin C-terminal domain-containing protein n=1 Tax=Triticum urartu TaxID=4572 RepID=A0A8R7QUQ0_TRIUA